MNVRQKKRLQHEILLAMGDKEIKVNPPIVRKRINYLSDEKKKGEK